jgi:hypothetical protein
VTTCGMLDATVWTERVLRALPKDRPLHLEKLIASAVDDSIGLDAETMVAGAKPARGHLLLQCGALSRRAAAPKSGPE